MGVRRPDARHGLHRTSVVVQESAGFSRGGGTLPKTVNVARDFRQE